jgi:hypothetical protein
MDGENKRIVVPANAGTHTPCRFNLSEGVATHVREHSRQGLWVPAFAGTTRWESPHRRARNAAQCGAAAVAFAQP